MDLGTLKGTYLKYLSTLGLTERTYDKVSSTGTSAA